MKTLAKIIYVSIFTFCSMGLLAQAPPPPNGNNAPDGDNTVVGGDSGGGGAPIGSGLAILLALGAAYGGKKVYDFRKKLEE
jgi:hypothetical protein